MSFEVLEKYSNLNVVHLFQVLSMNCPSFVRTVSERDWLKNSAKIWELIKSSPIISEYSRMLQSSGMFRK